MFKAAVILGFLLSFSVASFGDGLMEIKLPAPKEKGKTSLEEAIKNRRSERNLSGENLTLGQISQLLWACQGITEERKGFRSAPSAGAAYPLEIYLVGSNGFFHYAPETHSIKRLKDGDLRNDLSGACFGQRCVKEAPINIVICADFTRTTGRYGTRGENYVYIEVGHAAQNLHLEAAAEGLGSVPVGAFSDKEVAKVLSLPRDLVPVYVIPVGYIRE